MQRTEYTAYHAAHKHNGNQALVYGMSQIVLHLN